MYRYRIAIGLCFMFAGMIGAFGAGYLTGSEAPRNTNVTYFGFATPVDPSEKFTVVGSDDMIKFLPEEARMRVLIARGPCWGLVPAGTFLINSNNDGKCGFIRSSAMVP